MAAGHLVERARRITPVGMAVLALLAGSLFVAARWVVAADGDITRFVLAGSAYASPDSGVHVEPGNGYDGQFSYRLAVDPTELDRRANGVAIDSAVRLQRITYPVLAHVLSAGQRAWIPYTLVAVNLLALSLLALLAALLARSHGRPPWTGLLVAGYFGFATTLGRNLTEIVTAALLVAGVLALQREAHARAALAFAGAVLCRETALLLYVVIAATQLTVTWSARPATSRWLRDGAVALAPVAAFVAWQAVCYLDTGSVPVLSSTGKNLVLPFQDLVPAVAGWVAGAAALERADLIHLGQFVALAVLVVAAGRALRGSATLPGVKAAWLAALLLVVSLSRNVWVGPADFRTASELAILSAVVILGSRRRLRMPALALVAAGAGTALFRVTSL